MTRARISWIVAVVLSASCAPALVAGAADLRPADQVIRAAVLERVGADAVVSLTDLDVPGASMLFRDAHPDPEGRLDKPMRFRLTTGTGATVVAVVSVHVAMDHAIARRAIGRGETLSAADLDTVNDRLQGTPLRRLPTAPQLVGGRVLPLVHLAALFGTRRPDADQGVVIVAHAGGQAFGMLVDAIVAEQDLLPKSLGPLLRRVRWFSGAAQLGDGTLAPVLALDDVAGHGLAGTAAPPAAPAPPAGPRKVLVVEDSVTSRLLLKHILESAGYAVDTAVDGLDALSRLGTGRFDVVVSDVEMPNMDGLALTASIRATPATAELPVILVTSLQTPEQREAGLRAGADAYFTKGSFDQDRLLATVRRVAGTEAS